MTKLGQVFTRAERFMSMRKLIGLVLLPMCCNSSSAFADHFHLEYGDFLGPEVVGELQSRAYDVHSDGKFGGVAHFSSEPLVAGGIGLRFVMREQSGNSNHGVRLSFEGAGDWGRFMNSSYSTVSRGELLGGLGYEGTLGPVVLHTATVLGFDYQTFDVDSTNTLRMFSLRAGQQVGLHIQLASAVAIYGDATLDWDGQWRVRAGISVGERLRRSSFK
jgi:hypothetical protein